MNRDRTPPTHGRALAIALGLPKRATTPKSKACNKRAYPDFDTALTAAVRRRAPYPLRIYFCPDCGAHHLTSRATPARRQR